MHIGSIVTTTEHPLSIGKVLDITERGAKIEFTTPRSSALPYGHIITEFRPVTDFHLLVEVQK